MQRSLDFEGDDPEILISLGAALQKAGRPAEALPLYCSVLKEEPQNETAQYNLACAFSEMGKTTEALDALAVAVELNERFKALAKQDRSFVLLQSNERFIHICS